MSCGMLFGPLGHMVEIPAPKSGMGFDLNRDVTTSELVSGGRTVYRAPTGYKSFDMSWAGGTTGLGEFMDMYEGAYGNGPFYMLDPRSENQNLLPARWASCWQLGHIAGGWGRPLVGDQQGGVLTPEGKEVKFTGIADSSNLNYVNSPFRLVVPVEAGKSYNARCWGAATGGAQLLAAPMYGEAEGTPTVVPLTGANSSVFENATAVRFRIYLPAGSTLTLRHMEFGVPFTDGKMFHMGRGVGAVQFSGPMQGSLTGTKVDRIGLSVALTEVES